MINKIWLFILMFCCSIFIGACGDKIQFVGKWKRENPGFQEQTLNKNSGWGDMTFGADSTFFMQGDSTIDPATDTTAGWHVGGSMKGIWGLEKNQLLLYFDDFSYKFPLRYEIVQLTGTKLILRSSVNFGDTTMTLIYSRKK